LKAGHHESYSEYIIGHCNNSSHLGRWVHVRFYCLYGLSLAVTVQACLGLKKMNKNSLKEIRESLLISKSELSRRANVSPLTISRIEQGMPCRMETKRKILLALGLKLSDRDKVFH
jgi:DNA-binding XRE family transcriptional regulator